MKIKRDLVSRHVAVEGSSVPSVRVSVSCLGVATGQMVSRPRRCRSRRLMEPLCLALVCFLGADALGVDGESPSDLPELDGGEPTIVSGRYRGARDVRRRPLVRDCGGHPEGHLQGATWLTYASGSRPRCLVRCLVCVHRMRSELHGRSVSCVAIFQET